MIERTPAIRLREIAQPQYPELSKIKQRLQGHFSRDNLSRDFLHPITGTATNPFLIRVTEEVDYDPYGSRFTNDEEYYKILKERTTFYKNILKLPPHITLAFRSEFHNSYWHIPPDESNESIIIRGVEQKDYDNKTYVNWISHYTPHPGEDIIMPQGAIYSFTNKGSEDYYAALMTTYPRDIQVLYDLSESDIQLMYRNFPSLIDNNMHPL